MASSQLLTYVSWAPNSGSCSGAPTYYGASMVRVGGSLKLDQCDASVTNPIKYTAFTSDLSVTGGKWFITRKYEGEKCSGKLAFISATPYSEESGKCSRQNSGKYAISTCADDGTTKFIECSDENCSKDCTTLVLSDCLNNGVYKYACGANGFTFKTNEFSTDEKKARDVETVTKEVTENVQADAASPIRSIADKAETAKNDASSKTIGFALVFGFLAAIL